VVDDKSNSNEQTKDGANGSSDEQRGNIHSQQADIHPPRQTAIPKIRKVMLLLVQYMTPLLQRQQTPIQLTAKSRKAMPTANSSDVGPNIPRQIKLVDYASKLARTQLLEQSTSLKGASNLLTGDKDRYSIAPCEDKRYVIIGLSEDILVKQIKLYNYERYSSRERHL